MAPLKLFMFHGVSREKVTGVPECIYQKKETTNISVAKERWTLKVATLRDDPEILGLVPLSLNNIKLIYVYV